MKELGNHLKLGWSGIGWAEPKVAGGKLALGHLCPSCSFLCAFSISLSKAIRLPLQSLRCPGSSSVFLNG